MIYQVPVAKRPVSLYWCNIADYDCESLLSAGLAKIPERLHIDILRFKRREDRLSRVVARRMVSIALEDSGFFFEATLENWQTDRWGRPSIVNSSIDFSVSHSQSMVVVAMVHNGRVGVDVEHFRTIDLESIRPFLSNAELRHLATVNNPQREAASCWCLREAILKADGRGLLAPEEFIRNIKSAETPQGGVWRVENYTVNDAAVFLATDQRTAQVSHKYLKFSDLI
ncbi:MAG: 4'-phosphopantetheinyl transferase superfamily protein [Deltaproteobacteria bacterium]|nr:4'-phosphopantetheinyl transferase superfamily protein [Deltaproteobacteria bacterium]